MEDHDTSSPFTAPNGMTRSGGEGTALLTRLCALDTLFAATGTVQVKVTRGGVVETLTLPIQSVDNEQVEALARPYRPKIPTYRDQIGGQWKTVINEANPEYQDKLAEYNRLTSYIWCFLALAVDIIDEQHTVVWSADNRICDLEGARRVVKRMGLVDNQLIAIMRAGRDLTATVEDVQQQE